MNVLGRNLRRVLFALLAASVLFYTLTSLEYFVAYTGKSLTLWSQVFTLITSKDFVQGAGSIHSEMHTIYKANRIALQLHVTTGSMMLLLGFFQFLTPLRRCKPALHRTMGKIYVLLAIPTCLGVFAYLANVPPHQVFSGRVFMIALAGLTVATGFSTYMAYHYARQGNFDAHRAWMLQSYFYILSAPILRALWITIYHLNDGINLWDNNLYAIAPTAAIMAFGPLVFFGMKTDGGPVQSNFVRHQTAYESKSYLWRLMCILNVLFCCVAVLALARWRLAEFSPVFVAFIALIAFCFAFITFLQSRSKLVDDPLISVSLTALGLIVLTIGIVLPIGTSFGTAFPSSLVTIGSMLLFATMMVHLMRKWQNHKFVTAWQTMAHAIVFAPITVGISSVVFLLFGWSFDSALPAGFISALFLNPLIGYWQVIHGESEVSTGQIYTN